MSITGRVELTAEDLEHGIRAMPERRPSLRAIVLIGAFFSVTSLASAHAAVTLTVPIVLVLLVLLTPLRNYVFIGSYARRRIAKMAADERSLQFRFDAEGVTIVSGSSENVWKYSAISKSVETSECFLLYVSGQVVRFVPKRSFSTDDVARIRQILLEKVHPAPAIRMPWGRVGLMIVLGWGALIALWFAVWWLLGQR